MKHISAEDFKDGARARVLASLDDYMRELTGSDRAQGAQDRDLPELFRALDAHMERVAARFNNPESQEVGSSELTVIA